MSEEKNRAIALARKHIVAQRVRIQRQRALIDQLDKGESVSVGRTARQHLKEMLESLDRLLAELRSLQPELGFENQDDPTENPQARAGS